jgi:3-hydroxyacyl-CoA dehydrogenase
LLHEPVELVANRISRAATLADAVAGASYVQESVAEKIDVKREVFAEIAATAPADAILASSTSALPGSDFLGHVFNPQRCLVAHPVNPPSLIPLVEICPTQWTAEATINRARQILTDAGMKPVTLLKEIDGFLLNRLQYTLVAEALHLVGEGYCSAEDIDRVMTDGLALRWASIGPFEVAHLNSAHGFQGFVDHLGGMMRHMGRDAKTSYDWSADLIKRIHHSLAMRIPLSDIPKRQAWRNRRIMEVRRLQRDQNS